MKRLRLALLATAALFAMLGVTLLVVPPSVGHEAIPVAVVDDQPNAPTFAPGDPALSEDIVLANVFSVRRAPPASRYTPPDASSDSAGGVVSEAMAGMGSGPGNGPGFYADAEAGRPVLFGTLVGVNGAQALLQLDTSRPGARLYAVGDRDGGYRVLSIAPRVVVLAGPRGRLTLRMDLEEERP